MHVALVSGFWGQNIGNAFFNLGGEHALLAAGHEVSLIQDQSAYWTFRDEAKGSYSNSFDLLGHLEFDLLVLQGPLWTRNFGKIWHRQLRSLSDRGIPWAVLSGGFRAYSGEERSVVASIIDDVPPIFVSTRDRITYEMIKDVFPPARCGIDSAFFLPRAVSPPVVGGSYIAMTFDHFAEPSIETQGSGEPAAWKLRRQKTLDRLAARSKVHAYLAQIIDRRHLPEQVGDYRVVRPEHRTNPHIPLKIYRQVNAIASDEPWTYAAIYRSSAATFSDRVHACVLSLAYGTPAWLHNPTTKRKALFDRVSAQSIEHRLTVLPDGLLDHEFGDLIAFLEKFA